MLWQRKFYKEFVDVEFFKLVFSTSVIHNREIENRSLASVIHNMVEIETRSNYR